MKCKICSALLLMLMFVSVFPINVNAKEKHFEKQEIKSLDLALYLQNSKNGLWKEQVGRVLLYFRQYRLYDVMRQFVTSHKLFKS